MKCRTDSKEMYSFHFGSFSIVEAHGQLEKVYYFLLQSVDFYCIIWPGDFKTY